MEMQLLPWIEDDVAIEIIGKMISYQMRSIYQIAEAYRCVGYEEHSDALQQNVDYWYHCQRIEEFQNEIGQLYHGENRDALIAKATNEYAPYLKGMYLSSQAKRSPRH